MADSSGGSATPAASDGADGEQTRLSWKERELVSALRRVANARSQVEQLEAAGAGRPPVEPADAARLEQIEEELARLRRKAQGRFGANAARERLGEVEVEQRLLLERLGFESYDEFRASTDSRGGAAEAVDPVLLDFSKRELADAEEALQQVLAMPDADETAETPETPALIDLRAEGE